MTPVHCLVKHNPPNSYGDCVRACIASLLDLPAEHVPHFFHDDCDATEGTNRIREFLAAYKLAPFWTHYDGSQALGDVLSVMHANGPGVHYMLFGSTDTGDHVVICKDDKIVHDPAWYRTAMTEPNSNGHWGILVLVKL